MATAPVPGQGDASSRLGLKHYLYLLTGLAVGGAFLYIAARNLDFQETLVYLLAIKTLWILPLTGVFLLNMWWRSARWYLLFPESDRPPLRYCFDAFVFSRVCNNFIPGRPGDLLRITLLGQKQSQVGISGALATLLVEKVFDVFAILIMLCGALLVAPLPDWLIRAGFAGVGIFALLLLILWLADWSSTRLGPGTPGGETHSLRERILGFIARALQKFSSGLHTLRHAGHVPRIALYTALIWTMEIATIFCCFLVFSIPASPAAALVCMVFLCIGLMLPAAPGFVGTFQLFTVAALQLFDVAETQAFALAVFLNLFMIVASTLLGGGLLFLRGGLLDVQRLITRGGSTP